MCNVSCVWWRSADVHHGCTLSFFSSFKNENSSQVSRPLSHQRVKVQTGTSSTAAVWAQGSRCRWPCSLGTLGRRLFCDADLLLWNLKSSFRNSFRTQTVDHNVSVTVWKATLGIFFIIMSSYLSAKIWRHQSAISWYETINWWVFSGLWTWI